MPLARAQRIRLANLLAWSRSHGWRPDMYPHAWTHTAGDEYLRWDAAERELTVSRLVTDPIRWRAAIVPVESVEMAVDVLAALRHIPAEYSSLVRAPEPEPANCVRWFDETSHPAHLWNRDDNAQVQCVGWQRPHVRPSDAFDGPGCFTEAGQVLADLTDGGVAPGLAAEVLSILARNGLIVSPAYFDEVTGGGPVGVAAGGGMLDLGRDR